MTWVGVQKFIAGLIVVVCLIGVALLFVPEYAKYRDRQEKKRRFIEAAANEEAQRKHYLQLQERFTTDPQFVEHTAREVGMVKTNESVFRLTDGPVVNQPPPRKPPTPPKKTDR